METWRITENGRRRRLGEFMNLLSGGQTFASYRAILTHELEAAVARREPNLARPQPFAILGRGVSHAFGIALDQYRLPDDVKTKCSDNSEKLEQAIRAAMEQWAVHGVSPFGDQAPSFGYTSHNRTFKKHIDDLAATLSNLTPQKQDDALYAISIADARGPITDVLARHGLDWNWCSRLGVSGLKELVDDLPSRRVDLHLHRQVLRNPQLRGKITDLEDWAGLGPAVAYADMVVCERHFADLVKRDGFQAQAYVTTDLGQLAEVLSRQAAI
jgi:hypothetical protein